MSAAVLRVPARDGVELHVEVAGPKGGLPVLFSCGYSTTRENFRPQVAPLVDAGFRVLLWDYRGHGDSGAPDAPAAYTLDLVLDDLGRVLDAGAPGSRAVLAGFSFGGLASLHFALAHPERVRALALIDTGPGFKNPEAQAGWEKQVARTGEILRERGFAGFLAGKGATTAVGRRPELPAARHAAEAIAKQSVTGVSHFGLGVAGPAASCIDDLGRIDQPALVLIGEEDRAYLRAADVLTARLPNARRVDIAGAGHVVTLEEPEAVSAALLAFLKDLGDSG